MNDLIKKRLHGCHDLVAVEARYHCRCLVFFQRDREVPASTSTEGRPIHDKMHGHFLSLCHWLETDGDIDLYTVEELIDIMEKISGQDEVYSAKSLRRKLQAHYGDHVFFAHVGGQRKDVVCFRNMPSFIINEHWYENGSLIRMPSVKGL